MRPSPGTLRTSILDDDKNGLMATVHKLNRSKGLDLLLHTPGGDMAATESIIDYLHKTPAVKIIENQRGNSVISVENPSGS